MNYCIAGFGKVKSASEITSMMNHNLRTHLTEKEQRRIDGKRTSLNQVLVNSLGADTKRAASFGQKLRGYYDSKGIEVRKDNVLAIDLVLTTSPEYFGEWHQAGKITPDGQKKIDQWQKTQLEFLEKQFGKDAVKLAVLHLDETTPHLHVMITPEEKKVRTYKNQHGTYTKEGYVLNAKRWGPTYWKNNFLKNYAKANEPLGLKRGIEGSTAKNVPLKEYSAMVADAVSNDYGKAVKKIFADFVEELSLVNTKKGIEQLLAEKVFPKLAPLMKSNRALKKLLTKNRALEYINNKKALAELEKAKQEADARSEHYGKGLKIRMQLEDEIKELREKNKALENKLDEVEKKLQPPGAKLDTSSSGAKKQDGGRLAHC